MRFLHWFAGLVLAVELPVPIYWLVLHGGIGFWRGRGRAPYWVAVGAAWGLGGWIANFGEESRERFRESPVRPPRAWKGCRKMRCITASPDPDGAAR